MNAICPPFPANPTVGQQCNGWVWNGSTWIPSPPSSGMQVVKQVFTASGSYMPSPGLTSLEVECIGGGGGGGYTRLSAAGSTTEVAQGGGGGSGAMCRKTLPASLVLGGVVVTVGAGGAGAAAGAGFIGGAGGATSFGALCVANGGGGGSSSDNTVGGASVGFAGSGGAGGTGDVVQPGAGGEAGGWNQYAAATSFSVGCPRGGWVYGGANVGICGPQQAQTGPSASANTGAGGSGGVVNQMVGNASGGSGAAGICIVTEFCFGGQSGGGCGQAPIAIDCGPGWGGPC